ncbi:MAG: hypothetical protein JOZ69_08800, partial [Myxococcales bacterium]|nr:hypothetical protein [Myxococcales bacterium]
MSRKKAGDAPQQAQIDENEPTRADLAPVPSLDSAAPTAGDLAATGGAGALDEAGARAAGDGAVDAADAEAGVEDARGLPETHLRGLIEALVFAS